MIAATITTTAQKRTARPRQAWSGGAPHPFRRHAGTSLQFTGCMEGRLWFIDLGASGFRVGATKPVRYSKGVSEPLTHAEQEAILAAEQAGLCRLMTTRELRVAMCAEEEVRGV